MTDWMIWREKVEAAYEHAIHVRDSDIIRASIGLKGSNHRQANNTHRLLTQSILQNSVNTYKGSVKPK